MKDKETRKIIAKLLLRLKIKGILTDEELDNIVN